MKKLNIDGIKVFDYDNGMNLQPLIFIHAFPLNHKMWDWQVNYFRNKFRVITYDIRGLGLSQQDDNQFTMEKYAQDLITILDALKIDKTHACGLSIGGYILLRSFEINSERFLTLILSNTKSERDNNDGILSRSNAVLSIKKGKRNTYFGELIKLLLSPAGYSNDNTKAFIELLSNNSTDNGVCGAIIAMATRTDTTHVLEKINIPSLLISGEYDHLIPPQNAKKMKKLIKNSAIKIIKDAGHLPNIENPQFFNLALSNFFNTLQHENP